MHTRRIALMALGALTLAGLLAAPASAQTVYGGGYGYGPRHLPPWGEGRIDRRQEFQQRRIQEGIASGALTRREAGYLWREQATIRHLEQQALADGRLSRRERFEIERAQDRAAQDIARLTHNGFGRSRGPYGSYGSYR